MVEKVTFIGIIICTLGIFFLISEHPAYADTSESDVYNCIGYGPFDPEYSIPCADSTYNSNGARIGHEEPTVEFFSSAPNSGNNMEWTFTLPGVDPVPNLAGTNTANYQTYGTFWIGLALCDPGSKPYGACVPDSDANVPSTAGSALLELQFYSPRPSGSTFDPNSGWTSHLTIDSGSAFDGIKCNEIINNKQMNDGSTSNPLVMNANDNIQVIIQDTNAGMQITINDLTSGHSSTQVTSAANGYVHYSNPPNDCTTTGFDFHPEYATASVSNVSPSFALSPNVAFDFEIGHAELAPGDSDTDDKSCNSAVATCFSQDTDNDGFSFQADWPDGTANHPSTLILTSPDGNGVGPDTVSSGSNYNVGYSQMGFETSSNIFTTGVAFYPFFSLAGDQTDPVSKPCVLIFGNDYPSGTISGTGTVNDFGKKNQFKDPNGSPVTNAITTPCLDVTSPTVTGTPDRSPDSATPPTWYNHQLQVTWSGDDTGGSGVASCDGLTTYNSPDGSGLSVQGHCTDKQNNVGTGTFAFNYDATPPTITGAPTTTPNANNWYKSDVDIKFNCADATSGPVLSFFDVFVTLDGAGQSRTGTCNDNAGNSASLTVSGINLDKTPPVVTHDIIPPPNANGWNNANTQVHFTATDALSGIDGASFFDVFFTLEGAGQIATHTFSDLAGNTATDSVTINIDKTPPEAYNQFDPLTKDVQVFGRDALSGVLPGPVTPISVVPTKWSDDGNDQGSNEQIGDQKKSNDQSENKKGSDDKSNAELRTYLISDLAGNTLTVVEKVKKEDHQIDVKMVSLQYNNGQVIKLGENEKQFDWELKKDGTIKELDQEMKIGHEGNIQDVNAEFDAKKNKTIITVEKPKPETKTSLPGLVLLRMATSNGNLGIEFP